MLLFCPCCVKAETVQHSGYDVFQNLVTNANTLFFFVVKAPVPQHHEQANSNLISHTPLEHAVPCIQFENNTFTLFISIEIERASIKSINNTIAITTSNLHPQDETTFCGIVLSSGQLQLQLQLQFQFQQRFGMGACIIIIMFLILIHCSLHVLLGYDVCICIYYCMLTLCSILHLIFIFTTTSIPLRYEHIMCTYIFIIGERPIPQ